MGAFSAAPLATIIAMSLVELSPSILTMLRVSSMTSLSASASISGTIAASEVTKQSSVAILGWIMPLPLAIAPMRQVFPPSSNSQANSFFTVSVVMIASAASELPSALSALTSAGIAASMGSMGRICPITPVEATMTSFSSMPESRMTRRHICSAFCTPSALQVLALPLLQTIARAKPSAICALVTAIGAPLTLLRV